MNIHISNNINISNLNRRECWIELNKLFNTTSDLTFTQRVTLLHKAKALNLIRVIGNRIHLINPTGKEGTLRSSSIQSRTINTLIR